MVWHLTLKESVMENISSLRRTCYRGENSYVVLWVMLFYELCCFMSYVVLWVMFCYELCFVICDRWTSSISQMNIFNDKSECLILILLILFFVIIGRTNSRETWPDWSPETEWNIQRKVARGHEKTLHITPLKETFKKYWTFFLFLYLLFI